MLAKPFGSTTRPIIKTLDIPYSCTHPEGLFAPDTYFFAKGKQIRKF